MSDRPDALNLAQFDTADDVTLDPQIWMANLAALRNEQAELATTLESTALPDHWRPVRALDGFTTYRTEPSGQPAAWLAATAAPLTRADGILTAFNAGEKNPSLPSIAAGGELKLLLERLPKYRAIYVFESDMTMLAAVLRAQPLAESIRSGRCILVPPNQELQFLDQLLTAYPGLLPPGNIVCLPGVSAARLEELRILCEQANSHAYTARTQRLGELKINLPSAVSAAQSPRLAILALTPDSISRDTSASLAQAADALGWPTVRCTVQNPRDVHILTHCEAWATFEPNLTLCVKHPRDLIPIEPAGIICEWFLETTDVPEQIPQDDVLRLAATPRVYAALCNIAPPEARLAEWYWGCDPHQPQDPPPADDFVLLVADLPNDDAAACGITQPSHKQLWKQLRRETSQLWESPEILQPEPILAQAERASNVRLGEATLRKSMLGLIEYVLIPTAILGRIIRMLGPEPVRLLSVGQGWQRWPGQEITPFSPSVFDLIRHQQKIRPLAAIFAGALDPLQPALLQAGALGWPLLIHNPGVQALTPALGGILHPEQHYQPFSGGKHLRTAVQSFRQNPAPALRRATRTQEHLCQQHSYQQRLQQLKQLHHIE